MSKHYSHEKAVLFILKQGDPAAAKQIEGVEFYCSQYGAANIKGEGILDFWDLENGDTVSLIYKDYGAHDIYREDERIVSLSDIVISYKSLRLEANGFSLKVDFAGDVEWFLGASND